MTGWDEPWTEDDLYDEPIGGDNHGGYGVRSPLSRSGLNEPGHQYWEATTDKDYSRPPQKRRKLENRKYTIIPEDVGEREFQERTRYEYEKFQNRKEKKQKTILAVKTGYTTMTPAEKKEVLFKDPRLPTLLAKKHTCESVAQVHNQRRQILAEALKGQVRTT